MEQKNLVVLGIYPDRVGLEKAVMEFKNAGFRNADISALLPDSESTKEFAHEQHTKAPEGAAAGSLSGALLGGTLGWLAGIGSLAIPGFGPFIAAGPIMGALAGAGAGGALGGLTGALIGMGFSEYVAKRYEGMVRDGGLLLSVHCDNNDWQNKAEEIMKRTGARDITSTSEASADNDPHRPQPKVGNY